jgi:hypothetical protein
VKYYHAVKVLSESKKIISTKWRKEYIDRFKGTSNVLILKVDSRLNVNIAITKTALKY